jgi:hypothetical protein
LADASAGAAAEGLGRDLRNVLCMLQGFLCQITLKDIPELFAGVSGQ